MKKQFSLIYSFLSSNVIIYGVRVIARHMLLNGKDITAIQVDDSEKSMQYLATSSFLFLSSDICFAIAPSTLSLNVLPS